MANVSIQKNHNIINESSKKSENKAILEKTAKDLIISRNSNSRCALDRNSNDYYSIIFTNYDDLNLQEASVTTNPTTLENDQSSNKSVQQTTSADYDFYKVPLNNKHIVWPYSE